MTTILLIILAVIVLAGIWLFLTYNKLIRLRNEVSQQESGIDIQLKRRADLIPNLVETVKGYASHEAQTLQAVTDARARTLAAKTLPEKGEAAGLMQNALMSLFAVAEAYPELRAVESFTQLQAELTNTEDQISAARRLYNATVQSYNTAQQVVPASLVAGMFGFAPSEFFEIEDPAERVPVDVSFDSSK